MVKRVINFMYFISVKNKRVFSILVVFLLIFSAFTVYYNVHGKNLNLSSKIENREYITHFNNKTNFGAVNVSNFKISSNQKECNYTVPITFNSSIRYFQKGYIYQQLIQLNRSKIPQINSKFSNLYFTYGNGSKIYAWIMNIIGNIANIWLRLIFSLNLTIWINIGPKNLSLFGNYSFLGYSVSFFNAPLVFGTPKVPRAWDFSGTSLPNGFVNLNTNYTVNDGLYISGETAHYAKIKVSGTYSNNTGILTNMQVSKNGHTNIRQSFDYKLKGQEESSTNFWFVNGTEFTFATENRGPSINTGLINYGYNVIGINDSLDKNLAYGTLNNLVFSGTNTPSINASDYSNFMYCIGGSYFERYANYSWIVIRTIPPSNIMPAFAIGTIQNTYTVIFRSINLPRNNNWYINVTGHGNTETFLTTQSEFSINLQKGEYSYVVGNSTMYYPVSRIGHLNLNGSSIIIPVKFDEFAFLKIILTPWYSSLILKGRIIPVSGWIYNNNGLLQSEVFNLSLFPGNYSIKAIGNGYYKFFKNITLSSGRLLSINVTLSPRTSNFKYQYVEILTVFSAAMFGSIIYLSTKKRRK